MPLRKRCKRAMDEPGKEIRCYNCGAMVSDQVKLCPNCGFSTRPSFNPKLVVWLFLVLCGVPSFGIGSIAGYCAVDAARIGATIQPEFVAVALIGLLIVVLAIWGVLRYGGN